MKPLDMKFEHVCTACGMKLNTRNIAFSELDLLPYHTNMTDCNRKHPNSYDNHAKRNGHMVKMLSVSEAQQEWRYRRLQALDCSDVEAVMRLLKGPTTLRIDTVENAAYIVDMAAEKQQSTSEVIRNIITEHREQSGKYELKFTDTPAVESTEEISEDYVPAEESEEEYVSDSDDQLNNF